MARGHLEPFTGWLYRNAPAGEPYTFGFALRDCGGGVGEMALVLKPPTRADQRDVVEVVNAAGIRLTRRRYRTRPGKSRAAHFATIPQIRGINQGSNDMEVEITIKTTENGKSFSRTVQENSFDNKAHGIEFRDRVTRALGETLEELSKEFPGDEPVKPGKSSR